jgi:hypothetical protein
MILTNTKTGAQIEFVDFGNGKTAIKNPLCIPQVITIDSEQAQSIIDVLKSKGLTEI